MSAPFPLRVLKELTKPVVDAVQLAKHKVRWHQANTHNNTTASTVFPVERVTVGAHTYGPLNLHFFGHPAESIQIGSLCSIAADVHFLAGGEHPTNRPTTFPLNHYFADRSDIGSTPRGPIRIADDVWIGRGCLILSGVTIGQGAVIGAGSIIARDVPAYAVYAGGRVVRYRFDEPTVARMSQLDWNQIGPDELTKNLELLTAALDEHFLESPLFGSGASEDESATAQRGTAKDTR